MARRFLLLISAMAIAGCSGVTPAPVPGPPADPLGTVNAVLTTAFVFEGGTLRPK